MDDRGPRFGRVVNPLGASALCLGLVLAVSAHGAARGDEYAAVRQKLELCFSCHGKNGASARPEFPILAGQHLHYIYVQLKDFKSGSRKSDQMAPIAAQLDRQQMLTIAKFFSEQDWPRIGFRAGPEAAARGRTAADAGLCVQCHRGGYEGDSRIPRLAGQHPAYLRKTMTDFKAKVRNNSPAKSSLMTSYDDADIAALADYVAGF